MTANDSQVGRWRSLPPAGHSRSLRKRLQTLPRFSGPSELESLARPIHVTHANGELLRIIRAYRYLFLSGEQTHHAPADRQLPSATFKTLIEGDADSRTKREPYRTPRIMLAEGFCFLQGRTRSAWRLAGGP